MIKALPYGILGFLAGSVITVFLVKNAVDTENTDMLRMVGLNPSMTDRGGTPQGSMGMGSSMDDMMMSMEGKSGTDRDQAFLASMIVHHQGAIEMAQQVKGTTGRAELRKLADDIISAQTAEIRMMRQWQTEWTSE